MPSKTNARRKKSTQASPAERVLRVIALLGLVAVFALSGLLGISRTATTGSNLSPTPGVGSPTPLVFPTVSSAGTPIIADYTYIHPSALFSIAHLVGWDLPPSGEEKLDPSNGIKISRAGATFINGPALSVVHVFVERDPDRKAKTLADLNDYYDKKNLDAAWSNFTGGYKELKRSTVDDKYVIDFELYLNGNTFLGRQVSQFAGDWLKVTRLVTPNNNPQLMDGLQSLLWSHFTLYSVQADTPILWPAVTDSVSGYAVRYEPQWSLVSGTAGMSFIVSGTVGTATITMTTHAEPGKAINSDADVRAWVTAQQRANTILTVKPTTINTVSGYNVSYNDPDADGNSRSAVSTLLNGPNGTLYTLTFISTAHGIDLLGSDPTVPAELAQLRATFMLIPAAQLIATLTPTATSTATITPTPLPATLVTSIPASATTVITAAATFPATAANVPATTAATASAGF